MFQISKNKKIIPISVTIVQIKKKKQEKNTNINECDCILDFMLTALNILTGKP